MHRYKNANGVLWGDDSGYRDVKTLPENNAPLVVPSDLELRPEYDGISPYTGKSGGRVLAGGLRDGAFVVREAVARALDRANVYLKQLTGDEYTFVGLDGFRSGVRQSAGYGEQLRRQMAENDISQEDVSDHRNVDRFIRSSVLADGVFSWVKVRQDLVYQEIVGRLQKISGITKGVSQYARQHHVSEDDALYEYIIASRNSGIGASKDTGNLVFENNAHAGGGACDLMILNRSGKLQAITPFDYPGALSAYDFMEKDENFDVYRQHLSTDSVLKEHLRLCGYDPENFTHKNWETLRGIKRLQFHIGRAMGWTFYSMGAHGGEHWHEEPGNQVIDPVSGSVEWSEPQTSLQYPNRGNPGHTLQMFGKNDTAVWGGASAHRLAQEKFGLQG